MRRFFGINFTACILYCFLFKNWLCQSYNPNTNGSSINLESAKNQWHLFEQFVGQSHENTGDSTSASQCLNLNLQADMTKLSGVDTSKKNPSKIRVLYLATLRSLLLMMDRWAFHLYLAMKDSPDYDVILWGVDMPGFNTNETTAENIKRWFSDPRFDVIHNNWMYFNTVRGQPDTGVSTEENKLKNRASTKEIAALKQDLPGNPLIVSVIHEVYDESPDIDLDPDILFLTYEQFLGAKSTIDTCGKVRENDGCPINPYLSRVLARKSDAIFAYLPHGVHRPLYENVTALGPMSRNRGSHHHLHRGMHHHKQEMQERKRNISAAATATATASTATATATATAPTLNITSLNEMIKEQIHEQDKHKKYNVLLVGASNAKVYPLRARAQTAVKYTNVMAQLGHPGYHMVWDEGSDAMCKKFPEIVIAQSKRYIDSLFASKVCLIGSAQQGTDACNGKVSWAVRKYYEAIAAGCVVIGDVPADINIAPFVQNRLTGQTSAEIAYAVEYFMDEYNTGAFSASKRLGREYVLNHYTYDRIIERYYTPAIKYALSRRPGGSGSVPASDVEKQGQQNQSSPALSKTMVLDGVFQPTLSKIIVRNDGCIDANEPKNSTLKLRKKAIEFLNPRLQY